MCRLHCLVAAPVMTAAGGSPAAARRWSPRRAPRCCVLTAWHWKPCTASVSPAQAPANEHDKRFARHHTRVRTAHPKLGGLLLALRDDPVHVRAWATGAGGEEEFGRRLSAVAGDQLKVLHDRKLPRSSANVDHVAVTLEAVWVLDAKRYMGKVENPAGTGCSPAEHRICTSGGARPSSWRVCSARSRSSSRSWSPSPPSVAWRRSRYAERWCSSSADFGLSASHPLGVNGVWVGCGRAIRKRLSEQTQGPPATSQSFSPRAFSKHESTRTNEPAQYRGYWSPCQMTFGTPTAFGCHPA